MEENEVVETDTAENEVDDSTDTDDVVATDENIVDLGGHPTEIKLGESDPGDEEEIDETPAPAAAADTAKKIKFGGREFDSAEQLQAFVDGLEESQKSLLARITAPTEVAPTEPEVNLGELLFEDPAKALELLEKKIEAKFEAKERARDNNANLEVARKAHWKTFYETYPDLVEFEEDVGIEFEKLSRQLSEDTTLEKAFPILAKQTQARLDRIRDKRTAGKAVSSGKAVVGSSHGADVSRPKPKPIVETMTDQVRRLRSREVG